jgi:glutaredoxin
MTNAPITIYGLSTCPWCRKTKALFAKSGAAFAYTDYDLADAGTQKQIMGELEQVGASGFPFVRVGDQVVLGYQPERFTSLLAGSAR